MKEISFEFKVPQVGLPQKLKGNLKLIFSAVIVAGAFIARQNFEFTLIGTLILAYFGLSLIWKLDSRIAASLALFFLVATPILLMLKNDALAETFAIYAYYFLVITVIQLVFELKNSPKIEAKRPAGPVDNFSGQPKRKIV